MLSIHQFSPPRGAVFGKSCLVPGVLAVSEGGTMNQTYGFSVHAGREFERAVDSVTRALKKQGFGIVSDIDMQAIFKEKLALDERPYRILGACNPMLANQALRADPNIGLLLPCNVVVRQDRDGHVEVVFTAPEALLALANDDNLIGLGMEVRHRLEKVSDLVLSDLGLVA
jgi:uncharacterized protein (DUF302 family)